MDAAQTQKPVAIYTTKTCGYCKLAKEFFQKNSIAYNEYDVGTDLQRREEMINLTGQMGVPVITVGQDTIIGFNKGKLAQLLDVTEAAPVA